MVSILTKYREIPPTLLNRTICLKIRDQQEQKFLNICRKFIQPALNFFLDSNFMFHHGYIITIYAGSRK